MGKGITAVLLMFLGGFLLIVAIPDLLAKVGTVQPTAAALSVSLGGVLNVGIFGTILLLIGVMMAGLMIARLRAS